MNRSLSAAVLSVAVAQFLMLSVAPASAETCDARAQSKWAASGTNVSAEAIANGQSCANAVVTMVLRDSTGKPLWVETFVGAQVMVFAGVQTKSEMTKALGEWIDQKSAMMPRTDKLPAWPKGADAPQAGEFPFYPDEGIDRDAYLKVRAAKRPLFCYVQGMESMACVALDTEGGITKVGVQTFPG